MHSWSDGGRGMHGLTPYPEGVDDPDSMMMFLGYRCFIYSSLRECYAAPYQARRLAPGDMAQLLTRTMRAFLKRVLEQPAEQHRPPHGQTSAMIRMLRDARIVEYDLVHPHQNGFHRPYRAAEWRRVYTVTDRGRSVLAHIPAFREVLS